MVKLRIMKELKRVTNRAPQNRTIHLTNKEIKIYSKILFRLLEDTSLDHLKNKIICQDIDEAIKYMPDNFVDLMFIDPP